ncbi:hypothetical protein HO133_002954 [Letharia lupina]|uniref:Uncharacterized protein n=1 Tax=Letharia lupina TaxID=560253 RepID=A0A8H6FA25_9LECA|nr:uncharacterized protein HO133_002954 [Letharia lupina]KAF6220521.1 hypothetical protein HO133_002954 [Letharia lupina]
MELGSVRPDSTPFLNEEPASGPSSLRSSLDSDYYQSQGCDIHIYDDILSDQSTSPNAPNRGFDASTWHGGLGDREGLRQHLKARDPHRTRWISLLDEVANLHLGGHRCLDLETVSRQTLGGPTYAGEDSQFIWLHTQIWFVGNRAPVCSSMRQTRLRMVICLPTATSAGTLITNFVGPLRLAQEISSIYASRILDSHALGPQALVCVWILAFATLRTTAEQLDFTFDIFDPIGSSPQLCNVPKLDDLPFILEKSNRLARIDRQYDALVQLVISYSTTQITERLDHGREVAEQFGKIGVFLAGLAGIVAPMSLLTGFYGMNVKELTQGATGTLFEFWEIGIPVLLVTAVCVAFILLWMMTGSVLTPKKG